MSLRAAAVFSCAVLTTPVASGVEPAVLIEKIEVDGVEQKVEAGSTLRIPPGQHELDFSVRVEEGDAGIPMLIRATLAGFEHDWHSVSSELFLKADFLDANNRVIPGGQHFPCAGYTIGFQADGRITTLFPRREPLLVPQGAAGLRLTLTSGDPQTTGLLVLDDLTLNLPGGGTRPTQDLWRNSGFSTIKGTGEDAVPDHWQRGAGDPGIAQVVDGQRARSIYSGGAALALVDTDPAAFGEWVSEMMFDQRVQPGMTLTLAWMTAWHVNPGTQQRISYHEVGAGSYTLRVAGIAAAGGWTGASVSLPIHIEHFLWQRPWFWPVAVGCTVGALGGAGLLLWRQRMQRRIERLAAQHALEKDRARIARDMHDDLGARLTRISFLTALAERDITAGDTPAAQTHVSKLSGLAREVVGAIDEIVWAVDPGNDTLDHLGTYLCRFADEFFAGSPVRCRFGIPPVLPAVPLGAEVRHNIFLVVKEALNNIAKHAGPCEARLEMELTDGALRIEISDNGEGFTADPGISGNGLRNMERRLHDIGGDCTLSTAKNGTTVSLRWPLPEGIGRGLTG